jgi:WD40 repeat protein
MRDRGHCQNRYCDARSYRGGARRLLNGTAAVVPQIGRIALWVHEDSFMKRSICWTDLKHKNAAAVVIVLFILSCFQGCASGRDATGKPKTAPGETPAPTASASRASDFQTVALSYEYLFSFRHDDIVTCAAFSRDGRWLATGSEVGTVLVRDIESAKETTIKNPDSRDNGVVELRFSQDGQLLVVGGYGNKKGGGQIKILRTSNYTTLASLDVPGDNEISYVDLSPDNKWLISSDRGNVWVWNLETRSVVWHLAFAESLVLFDGDHSLLFVGQSASLGVTRGQIGFLNLIDGKVIRVLQTTIKEPVKRLVNAQARGELFALTDGPIVYRLDSQTGEIKQRVSLAELNLKLGPNALQVWYNTDFEVLEGYSIFVFSDRQHTLFVNYASIKVASLDHHSMVGIKFNSSGKNFALLGGVKEGSLSGVPPQHYWTVSLFSFKPF